MKPEKDFNVKISVRNNRLLSAIRGKFGSVAAMGRETGLTVSVIHYYVNFSKSPIDKRTGEFTKTAMDIAHALDKSPVYFWPDHMAGVKLERSSREAELDFEQVRALTTPGSDFSIEDRAIMQDAISRWSHKLTPREITVVTMRMGGATLKEIGDEFTHTGRERVREIEAKALRKIKDTAYRDGIRSLRDLVG